MFENIPNPNRKWKFEATIRVNGVRYTAGRVVAERDIPSGHLESLRRQGKVSEYDEKAVESALATVSEGADKRAPTVEDLRAAVGEIERLRQHLAANERAAAGEQDELKTLRAENADLRQQFGDAKKDAPPDGGAKPPVVGPPKPPEVKAGGKK